LQNQHADATKLADKLNQILASQTPLSRSTRRARRRLRGRWCHAVEGCWSTNGRNTLLVVGTDAAFLAYRRWSSGSTSRRHRGGASIHVYKLAHALGARHRAGA